MKKPVGLFDMDGTLCDYVGQLHFDMKGLASPNEDTSREALLDESKPWLKARMSRIKKTPGWWRNLPPLYGGLTLYHMAEEIGFQNEILTKGPYNNRKAWAEKCEWVDAFIGASVIINIVGENKGAYYGRFLCDDYVPFLVDWLAHRPRGLGIMIGTKENESFTHPNVIRFDGTNEAEVKAAMIAAFNRKPKQHWKECLKEVYKEV